MNIKSFGKSTEERIRKLEQKYALSLPKEYRGFLLSCNGGVVEADGSESIAIPELNQTITVEILYGLDASEDCFDIDYWMGEYGNELPESSIIIGDDTYKGFLVLICAGDNRGLYYWDDGRNFATSTDEKNVYFLSKSFTGLCLADGDSSSNRTSYIPLGSIVLLKEGFQKLLIISRALNVKHGDKTFFFDYGAVPYPEGLVSDKMVYFNRESISRVIFEGYHDAEDENMVESINRYIDNTPDLCRGDPKNWV